MGAGRPPTAWWRTCSASARSTRLPRAWWSSASYRSSTAAPPISTSNRRRETRNRHPVCLRPLGARPRGHGLHLHHLPLGQRHPRRGLALGFKAETLERVAGVLEAERRQHVPDNDGRLEPPDVPISAVADKLREPRPPTFHRALAAAGGPGRPAAEAAAPPGPAQRRHDHHRRPIASRCRSSRPPWKTAPWCSSTRSTWRRSASSRSICWGCACSRPLPTPSSWCGPAAGQYVDFRHLDFRDRAVYDQICSAHTIGIFQVESGAQVSIIPHLQPRSIKTWWSRSA